MTKRIIFGILVALSVGSACAVNINGTKPKSLSFTNGGKTFKINQKAWQVSYTTGTKVNETEMTTAYIATSNVGYGGTDAAWSAQNTTTTARTLGTTSFSQSYLAPMTAVNAKMSSVSYDPVAGTLTPLSLSTTGVASSNAIDAFSKTVITSQNIATYVKSVGIDINTGLQQEVNYLSALTQAANANIIAFNVEVANPTGNQYKSLAEATAGSANAYNANYFITKLGEEASWAKGALFDPVSKLAPYQMVNNFAATSTNTLKNGGQYSLAFSSGTTGRYTTATTSDAHTFNGVQADMVGVKYVTNDCNKNSTAGSTWGVTCKASTSSNDATMSYIPDFTSIVNSIGVFSMNSSSSIGYYNLQTSAKIGSYGSTSVYVAPTNSNAAVSGYVTTAPVNAITGVTNTVTGTPVVVVSKDWSTSNSVNASGTTAANAVWGSTVAGRDGNW